MSEREGGPHEPSEFSPSTDYSPKPPLWQSNQVERFATAWRVFGVLALIGVIGGFAVWQEESYLGVPVGQVAVRVVRVDVTERPNPARGERFKTGHPGWRAEYL
jgi:hypothetical protein